ncbi:MAG: hypothetical protein JWQ88_971 [Rhodoferax sp.]|nr:hypothetical protein [Rhodoferax sp.]
MINGKFVRDLDGEILRHVAQAQTTAHTDEKPKPINTNSETLEVLVFDSILTSAGSQFGHVAIDIDGAIYSRAHSKYVFIRNGTIFRSSNQKLRDFEGLVLRVSPNEKKKIITELERRVDADLKYDIINNSCSTNVADVLESIGILAHDPRFQLDPGSTAMVTPKEILITISRSKRLVKRNSYRKLS